MYEIIIGLIGVIIGYGFYNILLYKFLENTQNTQPDYCQDCIYKCHYLYSTKYGFKVNYTCIHPGQKQLENLNELTVELCDGRITYQEVQK